VVSHRAVVLHALSSSLRGRLSLASRTGCCRWCRCTTHWPGAGAVRARCSVRNRPAGTTARPLSLLQDIEGERATLTGEVPTIWAAYYRSSRTTPAVSTCRAYARCSPVGRPLSLPRAARRAAGAHLGPDETDNEGDLPTRVGPRPTPEQRAKQGRPMPWWRSGLGTRASSCRGPGRASANSRPAARGSLLSTPGPVSANGTTGWVGPRKCAPRPSRRRRGRGHRSTDGTWAERPVAVVATARERWPVPKICARSCTPASRNGGCRPDRGRHGAAHDSGRQVALRQRYGGSVH